MSRRHPIALVALAAALVVAGVACSDDQGASIGVTTTTTTAVAEVSSTEPPGPDDVEPASWEQVAAPPQCACSDGSPYHFWIRRADPERVVFFLEGGGACFSAATCGPTSPTFTRNLAGSADAAAGGPADAGIFDLSDERNPFADWSFVFVPYCTGDLHLGDATHDYGDGVVVRHNGAVNASTALAATAEAFPGAREVVVAGSSAGSAGAPMYAGITHDLLPDATVTLLADGSGAYPDDEGITTVIGSLWGAFEDLPDWPEQTGPPPGDWTLPRLLVQAGRHVPDLRVATLNHAYDDAQARFSALIGNQGDLLSMIESNNELVEAEGVAVRSWVGPGTEHTVLGRDAFYDDAVDGTALHEWVTDVVDGEDVDDVRCTECR
jgi:Pectinacetylesterase